MANENSERIRASNIIWNAAGDYSFESDVSAYDDDGRAELYMNYIIGAVHKYYDYPQLQDYFSRLDGSIDRELFEELIWTGLENCAFERGKLERPVLENLRRSYAKTLLEKYAAINPDANVHEAAYYDYTLDEVKIAHFRRALGETPKISPLAAKILDELEFGGDTDTAQIVAGMDGIIRDYFRPGLVPMSKTRKRKNRGNVFFLKFSHNAVAGFSDGPDVWGRARGPKMNILFPFRFFGRGAKSGKKFVQDHYGKSILPEAGTEAVEKAVCSGVHGSCHLHFTRGESASRRADDAMAGHRKKNESSFRADFKRHRTSITRLTNIIKNAMLINLEASSVSAASGRLEAGKVWRNTQLGDDRVFTKRVKDEAGDLSVDIMLDASASQVDRQEEIAAEAYIIAESLTRCGVPVRVFSYCSEKEYTIINLFRGYSDTGENDRIFNYFASGCNRDGLAVRTAVDMIGKTAFEHKILIVLTDGLPNDNRGVPVGMFTSEDYLGGTGVKDTALEVRRGWQSGISILCVFTGRDANLPDAKKIFGHDLAYIKSQNRFADIVGVMIQNELKNF